MTPNQKTLKVVGILQFILGIAGIALGGQLVADALKTEGALLIFMMAMGIPLIVCAALTLSTGLLSIRGANRPSSLNHHVGNSLAAIAFGVIASIPLSASTYLAALFATAALVLLNIFSAFVGYFTKKEMGL